MPFYDVYETSDGQHLSVGALEPQFFDALVTMLGVKGTGRARPTWTGTTSCATLSPTRSSTKTQAEWVELFEGTDACVPG